MGIEDDRASCGCKDRPEVCNGLYDGFTMRCLELFSGCGGLAKGLELAGFEHCGFVEFNKWACKSLRENFHPSLVHETDIRNFDFATVGKVDIVAGGPPCQPFSLGGLAKAHEDARDMFPEAIRAIHELRPKAFVFENVKGLLRASFAEYFTYIIRRLTYPDCTIPPEMSWREHLEELNKIDFTKYDGLKYTVNYRLLNAVDYGVPQSRERVFIVGFRNDVTVNWQWPEKTTGKKTIAATIGHLQGRKPAEYPEDHIIITGAREYPGHSGSDYNAPSKTIKAGAHGVPGGENMIRFPDGTLRYMTVHEAKLLQTFPADYVISGSWGEAMRQIGNAVPVILAEKMGRSVLDAFNAVKTLKSSTYPSKKLRIEQLRLAIEKRKKYSGTQAKGQRKLKKSSPTRRTKRPKSIKTQYVKHG